MTSDLRKELIQNSANSITQRYHELAADLINVVSWFSFNLVDISYFFYFKYTFIIFCLYGISYEFFLDMPVLCCKYVALKFHPYLKSSVRMKWINLSSTMVTFIQVIVHKHSSYFILLKSLPNDRPEKQSHHFRKYV